jgi:hypothetical protein
MPPRRTGEIVPIIIACGTEARNWLDDESKKPYRELLEDYLETVATRADPPLFDKQPETTYPRRRWDVSGRSITLFDMPPGTTPRYYKYRSEDRSFDIWIVFDKESFLEALDIPGVYVIYDGHSRYGQGPCFDPLGAITESNYCPDLDAYKDNNPWGDNVRMSLGREGKGFVVTPCIEDILSHCTNPLEKETRGQVFHCRGRRGCRHHPQSRLIKKRLLASCCPDVENLKNVWGDKTLLGRHFWRTRLCPVEDVNLPTAHLPSAITGQRESYYTEFMTRVEVGNEDLSVSDLKCSVLFMNSCRSKIHFFPALRKQSIEKRSKCVFYLTYRLVYAHAENTKVFVKSVLEGCDPTDKRPWPRFRKGADAIIRRLQRPGSGKPDWFTRRGRRNGRRRK